MYMKECDSFFRNKQILLIFISKDFIDMQNKNNLLFLLKIKHNFYSIKKNLMNLN